ncbi:DNA methyltransferase [Candidatus Borreliella tachyglossi]|uniref:DNA methyltransferase n=1 Tax=Candidatus Borreliella tachyglossi TaxID=1964448 RepID=UPI0035CCE2FD
MNLSSEFEELKGIYNLKIYRFLINNREIFTNSQNSYLVMMAHRIYYMHKVLKDTGSFYLHCDSTMSHYLNPTMPHYLKIICDIIFGLKNFRNEIVWCYKNRGASIDRWSKNMICSFLY